MSNYYKNEQWSFSWVVPVFRCVGASFWLGLCGLLACGYIASVVIIDAIIEAFSA